MSWDSGRRRRSIIARLIAVSVLFPHGAAISQAKGHGVQVRSVTSQSAETKPGQTFSLSFAVTSGTNQQEEFVESLELPPDWRVINPATTITLEAQKTQARIFAVLVPASTAAGEYDVTYSVQSQRDPGIRDFDSVKVNVLPVSRLRLLTERQPDNVIAGEEYQVRLRVLNEGNSESHLLISVRSTEGSVVRVDPDNISLPAGGSYIIAAKVKTDSKINRRLKDNLLVQARYADDKDVIAAGLILSAEVIPRKTGEDDRFRRIPGTVSLPMIASGDDTTGQVQFSGAGNLDDKGTRNVDFLLRGPDTQNVGVFGERDQQYLNYSTHNFDVRAGDQSYSLSRLTDYYRYGRGLAVDIRQPHGADFGAYIAQQRWGWPDERTAGLYLRKDISSQRLSLKLNALDKRLGNPFSFRDRLLSLEASVKPIRNTNILFEYGTCNTNREGRGTDEACSARLDGSSRGTYYSLERIHAGPDYYGYYRDTDYATGMVSFPLSKQLRGRVLAQRWKQNLDLDESRGASPAETRNQLGLSYTLASGVNLTLDHDRFHRHDLQHPSGYDYLEHSFRLGAGKSFGNCSIQTYVNAGKRDDILTGITNRVNRYSIYGSFRPSAPQYYSVYAQIGDCLNSETRLLGGNNSVGFYGRWKPTDQFTCTLLYGINKSASISRPDVHQRYLTGAYELADGRRLVLRFRHLAGASESNAASFLISYEMPWGLPIAKKENTGVIKGRIYGSENPGNPGIPRAIVTANGVTTVTDDKGDFEFRSLTTGTYSVGLERNSIGLDRVPTCKLPITVEVERDKSTEVEIPVARSAALVGKISIWSRGVADNNGGEEGVVNLSTGSVFIEGDRGSSLSSQKGQHYGRGPGVPGLTEGVGLSNILVELTSNHSEVVRALTNEKGEFSFDDLTPGKWRLTVYGHNLPAFHELEDGQTELDLEPGTKDNVVVRVIPRLRPVEIIERGVQLYSKKTVETSGSTEIAD